MLTSMAVNQQREGMKDHYAFWETQPVAQFTDLDENMPVSLAVHWAFSFPVWSATTHHSVLCHVSLAWPLHRSPFAQRARR